MNNIFLQNKYTKIYYNIINNTKSRTLSCDVYTEKHHIIPKSIGGNNDNENIVTLTAREHFICHWLLTKMILGKSHRKMIYALYMMRANKPGQQRYFTKITARVYELLKGKYTHSAETKAKMSGRFGELNSYYGKKHTEETLQKMRGKRAPMSAEGKLIRSNSQKGKPKSAETRAKMCGRIISDETRAKLSAASSKHTHSDESRAKMSAAQKTKPPISDETKARMSAAAKGRIPWNKGITWSKKSKD